MAKITDLISLISDVPTKKYKGELWFRASTLVTKYFQKSLVSQFIIPLIDGEDYRDFSSTNNRKIYYLSTHGIIKAVLKTSGDSLAYELRIYREWLLDHLSQSIKDSDLYRKEFDMASSTIPVYGKKNSKLLNTISLNSQEIDYNSVKKKLLRFYLKDKRWTKFFTASELYARIRCLQAENSENNLIYAQSILQKLAKEGFLDTSTRLTTTTPTYRIAKVHIEFAQTEYMRS